MRRNSNNNDKISFMFFNSHYFCYSLFRLKNICGDRIVFSSELKGLYISYDNETYQLIITLLQCIIIFVDAESGYKCSAYI